MRSYLNITTIERNKMLEGLVKFRVEYTGNYWLEVFLLIKTL